MEKKVLLFILVLSLIFILPLVFAAQEDIDNAYACLEDKIDEKTCDKLSVTEKIFTSLAVNRCNSELRAEAKDGECWPETNCNIKTTAQAVLALKTSAAKDWLINQNGTPSEITWYLQIEPSLESTCTITYDDDDYPIEIGEDKKINQAAGNCLSLSSSEYWLEIASNCYEEEFEISCDESFITNLLFRSDISSAIHVSEKTSSSTGGGTTTEKVNSFCFIDSGVCDYEGSLWAALALDSMGEDIAPYMPYLITMAEANDEHFPEVFLYILTGYEDFHYDIIEKQSTSGYWSILGDRYYGTALALYPFIGDTFDQKEEAKEWLLGQQESDGCWNSGSILDTAFILHSVWAKENPEPPVTTTCSDMGYYCMSTADCNDSGGKILNYSCSSYYVCCDTQKIEKTCAEAGGQICTGGEECTGITLEAADTYYCCFDECEEPEETDYDCVSLGKGVCERYECGEGYEQTSTYTCEYGDICCVPEDKPGPSPLFWILIILIILVVLGIVFRTKLKEFWFRIKSNFRKSGPPRRGPEPGFPHVSSTIPRRRIVSRRVLPSAHVHRRAPPKSPPRRHGELDEVLKKLKDMGK